MKLHTARGISELPSLHPTHIQSQSLFRWKTHFHFLHKRTTFNSGLLYYSKSPLRSTTSEETSTGHQYFKDEPKTESSGPDEEKDSYNSQTEEGSWFDYPLQLFKSFEDLNIKFDYEETYSILVFGGGGAVALWFVAAVISAIDSIPVFPKVLELIGLGYTLWFTSRYLLFKKNREELVDKVEQIKQLVVGSEED